MTEALLEVRKLGKRFGALQALDGVDVSVRLDDQALGRFERLFPDTQLRPAAQ